eukprot:6975804-Pyramimonas_sp.AAC.1
MSASIWASLRCCSSALQRAAASEADCSADAASMDGISISCFSTPLDLASLTVCSSRFVYPITIFRRD